MNFQMYEIIISLMLENVMQRQKEQWLCQIIREHPENKRRKQRIFFFRNEKSKKKSSVSCFIIINSHDLL